MERLLESGMVATGHHYAGTAELEEYRSCSYQATFETLMNTPAMPNY
jgi:hypothetical protein